jgi:polysaccharide export outer membrane protein
MNTNKIFLSTLLFVTFIFLSACGSKKDIVYFRNTKNFSEDIKDEKAYTIRIIPNDNLLITVSAQNPIVAEPYNSVNMNRGMSANSIGWQGYLVDENGDINFPILGKIHLGGLTKSQAIDLIQGKISKLIDDPVVNIRFVNYKISVLGEVKSPGIYNVNDEKISILEALALAGDLTIYGERHDVQICRIENGEKNFYWVDLTSPQIFYSPCYYLQQNDIVYVSPNTSKARASSTYNPNLPIIFSAISVAITTAAFFIRIK